MALLMVLVITWGVGGGGGPADRKCSFFSGYLLS